MMPTLDVRAKKRIARHIQNLNNCDNEIACRAETSLIRYYGARGIDQLLEVVDHPNPAVRGRAAWTLAHTREPRLFDVILNLCSDPEGDVRYDSAVALGILGDGRAVAPLIALMSAEDEVSSVDGAAADGLV